MAPPQTILELANGYVASRALQVLAEVGVADAVDGSRSVEEIAADTGVDADALNRLLRLLESHGIFRSRDGRWEHTDASRLLRSDHPRSMRAFARMVGMPFGWEPFTNLERNLRTGEPEIYRMNPDGLFGYLNAHPDQLKIFQASMVSKAQQDIQAVLQAYDFSKFRRVVDVGGGQGHLLKAIVSAHPDVAGVLFELPEVATSIPPTEGIEIISGDFFVDRLPTADAYILMDIIHDWTDDKAIEILKAVEQASHWSEATVLAIQSVLPEGPEPHYSKTLDILMLTITGGRERTVSEYRSLFDAAGLKMDRVVPTQTPFSIIEGHNRSG